MTLCVIFGAQPSYRQITSSSVSLAWMCSWILLVMTLSYTTPQLFTFSEWNHHIESTIGRRKKGGERRTSWETQRVMNDRKVGDKKLHALKMTWEILHARVLVLIHTLGSLQSMWQVETTESREILWFTTPVRQKEIKLGRYGHTITTRLMNQKLCEGRRGTS